MEGGTASAVPRPSVLTGAAALDFIRDAAARLARNRSRERAYRRS